MYGMKIKLFLAAMVVASIVTSNGLANDIVKRVVFPKGENTVVYKGNLPHEYASYHAYVIKLRKGQRLTVTLTTDAADAFFSIYETKRLGPDEDLIFDSKPDQSEFSGIAPITSEYSIQIYGVREFDDKPSRAAYSVEITVSN